jgi:outer membrane protein
MPSLLWVLKRVIFPHFKTSFMLKVKLSIFLLFALLSISSFAQDLQSKKVWTLEECIDYAKKNSLSIRRGILNRESNEILYDQSIATILPSVNASASNSYRIGNARIPNSELTVKNNAHSASASLDANMNIFNGFRTMNSIKQYKANLESSMADLQQVENNLSLSVASAYLDILFNDELLKVSKLQLASSEEQVKRTEVLVKAGALAEVSLLDVKAQAATSELNVVNAENALALSKLTLLQLLLLPADTDFEIVIPQIGDIEKMPIEVSNSNDLYSTALSTQPTIKRAELAIKGARYQELAAKGSRYPRLTAFGSLGSNYYRTMTDSSRFSYSDFRSQFKDQFNKIVGVQISIPIFNNYQTRTQIQNATINLKRTELNSVETKNTLRQDVEQAFLNAKAASKRYYATKNQLENLRESFRVTEQRFAVGAVNSLDFALAKNNLNQSESDFVRAKYNYLFRLKILDFYQNKPLTLSESK